MSSGTTRPVIVTVKNGATTETASVALQVFDVSNPANPTLNMSIGESRYDGINFGVRRRMTHRRPCRLSSTRAMNSTCGCHGWFV